MKAPVSPSVRWRSAPLGGCGGGGSCDKREVGKASGNDLGKSSGGASRLRVKAVVDVVGTSLGNVGSRLDALIVHHEEAIKYETKQKRPHEDGRARNDSTARVDFNLEGEDVKMRELLTEAFPSLKSSDFTGLHSLTLRPEGSIAVYVGDRALLPLNSSKADHFLATCLPSYFTNLTSLFALLATIHGGDWVESLGLEPKVLPHTHSGNQPDEQLPPLTGELHDTNSNSKAAAKEADRKLLSWLKLRYEVDNLTQALQRLIKSTLKLGDKPETPDNFVPVELKGDTAGVSGYIYRVKGPQLKTEPFDKAPHLNLNAPEFVPRLPTSDYER